MARNRRSRLQNAGWSALLTLSLFGCVEIFFRRFVPPADVEGIELDYNADLMWTLAERAAQGIEVNSLGIRGPELDQSGHTRLLSLGDSSVFGDQVRYDQVFTTVAATTLGAAGRPVEPVIGAIPGYSTFQARRWYAQIAPTVRPAMVLIGNLWSDAIRRAYTDSEEHAWLLEQYGSWRPLNQLLRWPGRHLASVAWLQQAVHDTLKRRSEQLPRAQSGEHRVGWITDAAPQSPPPPGSGPTNPGAKAGSGGLAPTADAELTQGEAVGVPRVPLTEYRENLLALVAAARQDGATPMLLLLPHPRDDASEALPERYAAYREVMRGVATEQSVPLVDGERWFKEHPCDCERFADAIHPNAAGHATLADALVATMTEAGLPQSPK